jgi:hypothetical protein
LARKNSGVRASLDSHLARKFLIFFGYSMHWAGSKRACTQGWLEHSQVRPALNLDKKRKFGEAKVTKSMIKMIQS